MAGLDDFDATLAAAKLGDERAAGQLFRAFQPALLRYLRYQERDAAEDIASEVWAAAARSIQTFEGSESGYRAWLFTVARRRVTEHRRKGSRRRTDAVDPATFLTEPAPDDPAGTAADSLDAQEAIQLMAKILTPDQCEVLVLRVVADLSAAEVGALMERPESWVRVTQHRALKVLASRLDARMEVTR
ncbi:MAG: RNA polymerase sigma factor [Actinomycetota bacterium]|nr:RNA polymerase sigma factor [Actinomycetota bacterium]